MYKRQPGRLPLRLLVEIHKDQQLLGHFVTRDIDQAGVFIEAPKINVHPNDILELVFRKAALESQQSVFRAAVMRREVDGVGLMFLKGNGDDVPAALFADHAHP